MSSILDIPENLQFPPDYKSPPNFNHLPFFDCIYARRSQESNTSQEYGALNLGIEAIHFLIQSLPPAGSDYVAALEGTPVQTRVFHWKCRQEAFVDYLHPYQTEVRNHGAPEQQEFIRDVLDMTLYEYIKSKSLIGEDAPQISSEDTDEPSDDDEYQDETFPEPAEAITILERIAQSHASTSVEYVALQITIRALRYLIESGEAPEFMRYVDQMSKWKPSSVE